MTTTVKEPAGMTAGFEAVPMDAALGAEIRGVDLAHLDDAMFERIHAAWLEHLLLVFRGQSMVAQDLVRLAVRFGTPVSSSNLHQRDLAERTANKLFDLPPEVTVVTNLQADGKPVGILGDGELAWHSDFSFKERPTAARMLLAVEIPPAGQGKTYFVNCYAAYETLSDDMKRRLSGKTIKQGNVVDTAMKLRPGARLDADVRELPGPSHPIVATHPKTGRSMLYLGRRHSAYVNGLTVEESEALLDELWAHCTDPQFCYTHVWQVGDVVVWDNQATLHRRDAFDTSTRRVLYAAQVEGERLVEAPDALARPAHPRFRAADRLLGRVGS
jgi:taurine dioxygenase